ncbi:cAMP phosphodiesterases class-II-domain-containing protein [Parachaetomium inaequale]|uniref:cAMP phosphodiesterases class-II-domain-containing protein n=1 Tax=Parachaetomium inaequale TaxID=2588326 RepID=A0AAN6P7N4_9PEZI|nr:cAMP phosphodiesterases class-II-domain-containing protein [Parachaetomium inaequale]
MGGGSDGASTGEAAAAAASGTAPDAPASPPVSAPALQVIVLGSGGGPLENNVTAFLVRSVGSDWSKGSVVAVDAGVHLGAIKTILEQTQPANLGQPDGPSLPHTLTTGPFAGLELHNATADANAAHIHKSLIETYLITHPHLDHIAGFVINTAGLPGSRPKRVAGLPSTITALKTHVFNNVIWPNLSDENNGAGLVTYMRLVEGGSPALGEGEGKGYLEICSGLAVKVWSVSHGHCIERHSHRGSSSTRHGSFDASSMGPGPLQSMPSPPRNLPPHTSLPTNIGAILQQHERLQSSPAGRRGSSFSVGPPVDESVCVYDSSVYFIRHVATEREILMFGDVEPDSISLSPRNRQIWQEAAPKIVAGNLAAIFIECSYDDSRCVERLFGHLTPRFICEEMTALAEEVVAARQEKERTASIYGTSSSSSDKKRKRVGDDGSQAKRKSTPQTGGGPPSRVEQKSKSDIPLSPRSLNPRRRVNSTASSASASDLDHSPDLSPPKTLPLPTHPLRSTTTAESTPRPGQEEGVEEEADGGLDQLDMTTTPSRPSSLNLSPTAMAPTPLTIPTSHPHSMPPLEREREHQHGHEQLYQQGRSLLRGALRGLKVVVMHVKESMVDGPKAGEGILEELRGHEGDEKGGAYFF